MKTIRLLGYLMLLVCLGCKSSPNIAIDSTYEQLFAAVQMAEIYPDSKTFVDCIPKYDKATIATSFAAKSAEPEFDLKTFVEAHYDLPPSYGTDYSTDTDKPVNDHINALWAVLQRQPDSASGTLIALPNPYIVPGGRFREVYYWDSYFTMLGLQADGKTEVIRNMIDNFAYLIDEVGFIPNGNRTYYKGRSQPPFFAMMIEVLAEMEGESVLQTYLPALEKEYQFWMDGAEQLTATNPAARRVVRMPNGTVLNRYWDDFARPRPESFREDSLLLVETGRNAEDLYRNLRAGAESGWDYSSRWLRDTMNLGSIHTIEIVPVDLNSLIYHMEITLSEMYRLQQQPQQQQEYLMKAMKRKTAVSTYCWNEEKRFFYDYDFVAGQITGRKSLAAVYPLFFRLATEDQALGVSEVVKAEFVQPHGVLTTIYPTGQQWDAPNGWAPLQWLTIQGVRNYGFSALGEQIKASWVRHNIEVFRETGKLVEKYNVVEGVGGSGGEYPNQDGFGWTNGVLLRLLTED